MSGRTSARARIALDWLAAFAIGTLPACRSTSSSDADASVPEADASDQVQVRIFHSADEHGWLQPYEDSGAGLIYGGVANFKSWLVDEEGFDPERDLLLSGGDNWTGPAISTWFQGEPTVAAFNAMGYRASVIGNHEFDFGRDALDQRVGEAEFPFLAANLRFADSGEQVDFADPRVMLSANGVQVAVIGLAGTHTATSAHPERIAGLEFAGYADTLATEIPAARAAGADIVVVLAHECADVLQGLFESASLDPDVVFAAHCHARNRVNAGEIPIISSGAYWSNYSVTSITYDTSADEPLWTSVRLVDVDYGVDEPNPVTPDPELAALVDTWQEQADEVLAQEVGYTSDGIAAGSWEQANWITDAWLWAFPTAELAVCNFGSFRQSIPTGAFTVADVVGVLPFENNIYEVEITGAQLVANLEQAVSSCAAQSGCYPAVAGMSYSNAGGSLEVTLASGEPFDPAATHRVLVNDFMYYGGDGYSFESQDPTPYDTAQNIRQPVIDWTRSLETSAGDPLENYVDAAPRD